MSSRFDKLNLFTRQSVKNAVRSQDPNQLVQATKNVHSLVDREIVAIHEQAAKDGVAPACQPGCSFCCHRLVAATLPEVIGIADYVSANFSVAEREELSLRAEASAQTNASFWRLDSQFATGACAFLNEGQCTIYEARPLSCRARNSTDANSCRDFFLEGRGEQKGVLDEQAGLAELNSSILNLCRDVGLASGLYELGPAVLELLDKSESANLERFKVFSEWTREQPAVHPVVAKSLEDPGKQEILKLRNADRIEEMWDRLDRYKGSSFASIFSHSTPPEFSSADELELWWGRWGQALDRFENTELPSLDTFELLQLFDSFTLAYLGKDVKPYLERFMRVVHRHASTAYPQLIAPIERKRRPGKPRLGFISYRIKNFNGSRWALGWLQNLPPDIESYVINLTEQEDHTSRCFRRASDHYLHLPFTVSQAAPIIRNLDLDALIFTDVGMDGHTTQLACLRLARKQYAAWGHPVTSGSPTMDFYLASDLMEPSDAQEHYSEKLVRLPGIGVTYQRRLLTPSNKTRGALGLPEGCFLLFCQHPSKQLPQHDHMFEEIAERTSKPIVFLSASPTAGAAMRSRIEKLDVDSIFLPFQPMPDYLRILQLADASIDSLTWSGGVTTIDAIAMGTPTVHLPGAFMRSRMSKAFLEQAGAPGLIAKDESDFVALLADSDRQHEAMQNRHVEALYEDASSAKAIAQHVIDQAGQ